MQLALARDALLADLGEAGGQDHERANAELAARARDVDDVGGRHGDHRHLDRLGQVAHRGTVRTPSISSACGLTA